MNCHFCNKAITEQPFATAPPNTAWCSRQCWSDEGERSKEKLKNGEPLDWNPKAVRIGRNLKPL